MQITKQWKINLTCKWGNRQDKSFFRKRDHFSQRSPLCHHRGSGGRAHFQSSSVFSVPLASSQSSFCSAWNARRKVSISQPARLEMFEKVSNSLQRPLTIKNFPASWMCTAEHLFRGTPPVGAPVGARLYTAIFFFLSCTNREEVN